MAKKQTPETGPHLEADRGVYLLVCDESEEFSSALHYAAMLTRLNGSHLAILHAINFKEFVHWGKVEDRIKKDTRERAEKIVWSAANKVFESNGVVSAVYIEEGELREVVESLIASDDRIRALVLGAGTGASGPGPLVSYFTGKGISKLKVPLLLVPDQADMERLEQLNK